jgi:hypothetical protein
VNEPTAPAYTIADSLRWFAIVYALSTLGAFLAIMALAQIGVQVPGAGLSIGLFLGIAMLAGQRFATKRDGAWTPADRGKLALGYAGVSLAISGGLLGIGLAMSPQLRPALPIALAVLAAVTIVCYGLARFALAMVAKRALR